MYNPYVCWNDESAHKLNPLYSSPTRWFPFFGLWNMMHQNTGSCYQRKRWTHCSRGTNWDLVPRDVSYHQFLYGTWIRMQMVLQYERSFAPTFTLPAQSVTCCNRVSLIIWVPGVIGKNRVEKSWTAWWRFS